MDNCTDERNNEYVCKHLLFFVLIILYIHQVFVRMSSTIISASGSRYLYIKNHRTKTNTYVQRLIPLNHVQYIEFDSDHNEMRIKMVGSNEHVDVYKPETGTIAIDKDLSKRMFYDILRDARADGKVIEGW